jgi:hypothetical protein
VVRRSALPGLLLVAVLAPAPAAPQGLEAVGLKRNCLDRLRHYLGRPHPGHFYYAEETGSGRYACGFSDDLPGEFDRYPGSRQRAFTACQNRADEWEAPPRCRLVARGRTIVVRSWREATGAPDTDEPPADRYRCDQPPRERFFWVERGFCDHPPHGPERAAGVVIWSHGISGTNVQYAAPPAALVRLLRARGWDVLKINRHNLAETAEVSASRGVQRTREEVAAQRRRGYRRVILAGQSFGGRLSLEAAESTEVYGVLALAPGGHDWNRALDAATEQSLARVRADRVAVVFPGRDLLFGSPERGAGAARVLAGRRRAWLLLDETSGLTSHGGGVGGKAALLYGRCVADFFTAPALPGERAVCAPRPDDWEVARLLLPAPPAALAQVAARHALPPPLGDLAGTWWGLLDDGGAGAVVSVALLPAPAGHLRLRYGWAGTVRAGTVLDAVVEGGAVTATLRSGTTIALRAAGTGEAELAIHTREGESNFARTAGASGGPRTFTVRLRRAPAEEAR